MRSNLLTYTALLFLVVALVVGSLYLAERDASLGNGYPNYSSFRADPSGCKVIYESLAQLGSLTVNRNYRETNRWRGSRTTLLVIGIYEASLLTHDKGYFSEWERLAKSNRILLSVEPSSDVVDLSEVRKKSQLAKRWGVELGKSGDEGKQWRRAFTRNDGWTVLSSYGGKPVLLERHFGGGSIVLASDSLFLTNGALANQAQVALISTTLGANTTVEFDEAHFGMTETGSVIGLARKYHLQGLFAGLAILAALFLWKTGAEFPSSLPQLDVPRPRAVVASRDAQQGFLGLLKRNVPVSQLAGECLREWRKTALRDGRFARMQAAADAEPDPVRAYTLIRKALDQKEGNLYE